MNFILTSHKTPIDNIRNKLRENFVPTEMFEISPYAEFALGFRTFDHVENQDLPSRLPSRPRFDTGELSCSSISQKFIIKTH